MRVMYRIAYYRRSGNDVKKLRTKCNAMCDERGRFAYNQAIIRRRFDARIRCRRKNPRRCETLRRIDRDNLSQMTFVRRPVEVFRGGKFFSRRLSMRAPINVGARCPIPTRNADLG